MDFYDVDLEFEQFDFQDLANEYLDKTKDLFNEQFEDYINQIKSEKHKLEEEKQKLNESLKTLEEERNNLLKTKADFEGHKNELIQEVLSEFGLDLVPNQTVYVIANHSHSYDCPHCEGFGKIYKTIDGVEYETRCKECNGTGYKYSYTYEVVSGTVSDMIIRMYWNVKNESLKEHTGWCWEESSEIYINNLQPRSAFCDSSKCFKRKHIYLTKEDAEKAIQERIEQGNVD